VSTGEAQRAKLAYCGQYLAAVQLLLVATAGMGSKEARLYRYAAALQLDARHRSALTRESVARNKALGNFKCVAVCVQHPDLTAIGWARDNKACFEMDACMHRSVDCSLNVSMLRCDVLCCVRSRGLLPGLFQHLCDVMQHPCFGCHMLPTHASSLKSCPAVVAHRAAGIVEMR
jgi:hypothetical protein